MPDTSLLHTVCPACGARWSDGEWDSGCDTCGGGALSRPCPPCEGRCGESWLRIVSTGESGPAYSWVGTCRLMDGTLG